MLYFGVIKMYSISIGNYLFICTPKCQRCVFLHGECADFFFDVSHWKQNFVYHLLININQREIFCVSMCGGGKIVRTNEVNAASLHSTHTIIHFSLIVTQKKKRWEKRPANHVSSKREEENQIKRAKRSEERKTIFDSETLFSQSISKVQNETYTFKTKRKVHFLQEGKQLYIWRE